MFLVLVPCDYYQRNGFSFMFSTEEQEKEYRNITAGGPLKTRLMYFDLMQIVKPEGEHTKVD